MGFIRSSWTIAALASAASLIVSQADGEGIATSKVTISFRSNFGQEKTPAGYLRGCLYAYDSQTLIVRKDGKKIIAQDFCSSLAEGKGRVVVDDIGRSYIFLVYNTGRASPEFITEHLVVLRVGDGLADCARGVVSKAASLDARWAYKSEERTPKGGGIALILHRKITGSGALYYPRAKTKTVLIDTPEQPCQAPEGKGQKITGDVIHPFVRDDDDYDRPWTSYSAPSLPRAP